MLAVGFGEEVGLAEGADSFFSAAFLAVVPPPPRFQSIVAFSYTNAASSQVGARRMCCLELMPWSLA
jgi:hypothetical protein